MFIVNTHIHIYVCTYIWVSSVYRKCFVLNGAEQINKYMTNRIEEEIFEGVLES